MVIVNIDACFEGHEEQGNGVTAWGGCGEKRILKR